LAYKLLVIFWMSLHFWTLLICIKLKQIGIFIHLKAWKN